VHRREDGEDEAGPCPLRRARACRRRQVGGHVLEVAARPRLQRDAGSCDQLVERQATFCRRFAEACDRLLALCVGCTEVVGHVSVPL
jgi:hypothetical protein